MIEKLTKENLIKLGFKESDVNELYNTKDNYSLQCNEGNIFVSKPENKLYTGVDFYRKTYFTEKNTNFPFKCPDLFNEYFELSLAKFFEKQKVELSIHFDEKTQFEKFILLETNRSKENIKDTKEFIKAHPDTRWHGKERANNVLETYIQFLDNKLFINEKTNNKKPEPTFLDFIHNVKDKEAFAEDLKSTFSSEIGQNIKALINLLGIESNEIIIIPQRKFRSFVVAFKNYLNRDIGTYNSINDVKHIDDVIYNDIEKKLKPLITKHKINK